MDIATRITLGALLAGWFSFGVLFLLRRRSRERGTTARRSSAGLVGLFIQGLGFAMAWLRRPDQGRLGAEPSNADFVLTFVVVALLATSISLALAAVRTLGKQWALDARVLEKHALITSGPYSIVRHPIYTAMGGMLLATGLAVSPWWALVLGLAVFVTGTLIRTRAEEALLRTTFGAEYEAYRARVPALLPWPRG